MADLLDRIHIRDLLARCIVGIYAHEREQKQDVVVPESTGAYKDPNPAVTVEDRYQQLLKQYGLSN